MSALNGRKRPGTGIELGMMVVALIVTLPSL